MVALPLMWRKGLSVAEPFTVSRKSCGSRPRPSASAIASAMAAVTDRTQLLTTSLSFDASPTLSSQIVLAPMASKTGWHRGSRSRLPAARTVRVPSSAGFLVPMTGASTKATFCLAGELGEAFDRFEADRGALQPDGFVAHRVQGAAVDHGLLDGCAVDEDRHDEVGAGCRVGRGVGDGDAVALEGFGLVVAAVPGPDGEAGLLQVARDRRAHDPGAKHGDGRLCRHVSPVRSLFHAAFPGRGQPMLYGAPSGVS